MPRKGVHQPKPPVGDLRDPDSLYYHLLRFLAWLSDHHYSTHTVEGRDFYLRAFIAWCDTRGLTRPHDITKPILESYQRYLFLRRKKNGEPLTIHSQHTHLVPVRAWFKWLARQNHILYNPAADIELPRLGHRLPRYVLSQAEAEMVLAVPDLATITGLRDRAIMETLYSTGMRRSELLNLKRHDVDAERGTVMIREGKGRKDRLIPIGERALAWIAKYKADVRPELATGMDDDTLFLTHLGEAFAPIRLTQMVRDYIDAARIGKRGSCHLFRHTMATLMLENGADIRYIQAMLGHAKLDTTQIYTQVSIRMLKTIHTATHPGKPVRPRGMTGDVALDAALLGEEPPAAGSADELSDLLTTLDAEAGEENENEMR
jgi:integrase/recombinase XerD